jgi:hypothetical protein
MHVYAKCIHACACSSCHTYVCMCMLNVCMHAHAKVVHTYVCMCLRSQVHACVLCVLCVLCVVVDKGLRSTETIVTDTAAQAQPQLHSDVCFLHQPETTASALNRYPREYTTRCYPNQDPVYVTTQPFGPHIADSPPLHIQAACPSRADHRSARPTLRCAALSQVLSTPSAPSSHGISAPDEPNPEGTGTILSPAALHSDDTDEYSGEHSVSNAGCLTRADSQADRAGECGLWRARCRGTEQALGTSFS